MWLKGQQVLMASKILRDSTHKNQKILITMIIKLEN